MKYLQQLMQIDSEIYDNMSRVSQKTIDIVQDTIRYLDRDDDGDPVQRDELGAINYDISTLLKVWNPQLEYDIDVLQRFDKIIEAWKNDVDFVNRALGIPPEKG